MHKQIFSLSLCIIFLFYTVACNPFSRKEAPVTELPVAQTAGKASVEIFGSKQDILATAVRLFVDAGFPVMYTDSGIGLVTTDFTKLKTSFGGELAARLFGTEDFELMLSAYITSLGKSSILTILPKGRIKQRTKWGIEYEDFGISKNVYERVDNLAQLIKKEVEKK